MCAAKFLARIDHPAAWAALVLAAVISLHPSSSAQVRTGVTLVPLDVRVVDRDGNPVTDLVASDFTIYEDDVPQELAYFLPEWAMSPTAIDRMSPVAAEAAGHRTFVIVLGRGLLNKPVKALDALIEFVQSNGLPTDRFAVIMYLRATELTTDRRALVRLLERFRDQHEKIDAHIRGLYVRESGAVWLTPETRSMIDAFFDAPGLPPMALLPGAAGDLKYAFEDSRELIGAIEYLRTISGEKQLVFVSESPLQFFGLIDSPNHHHLVRLATGARVALSFINTGGVPGQSMWKGHLSRRSLSGDLAFDIFAAGDHRLASRRTGGLMTAFYQDTRKPLANLDRLTRFQYLLAYYPKDGAADGRHRIVRISVKKPGLTAVYRHGYQQRPPPTDPADMRRTITESRIADIVSGLRSQVSAPRYRGQTRLDDVTVVRSADGISVRLRVSFDGSRIVFTKRGDRHVADLDLGVILDDENRELLAERLERVSLEFSAAEHARITGTKREFLEASLDVRVETEPAFVRVVVFEYESNWWGTDTLALKPGR
jgi:VWFA-related protein